MRYTVLKTEFQRLYAIFILVFVSTLPVSSQYYLNVFQNDGRQFRFVIADIDSINITAIKDTLNNPDPSYDYDHEYVDLGLSVKWATCNVGASQPEEYGDYYAWGETDTKGTYGSSTYNYAVTLMTKYNVNGYGNYVSADTLTTLDRYDDVVRMKWGGRWRMPTKEELNELINNCIWSRMTKNGVDGYLVCHKSGSLERSIFLPAAGFRNDTSLYGEGYCGKYWSSSLKTEDPYCAWSINFNSYEYEMVGCSRDRGLLVRPVCP